MGISQQNGKSTTVAMGDSMCHLMSSVFSMEDKVYFCLQPKNRILARSEEVVGNSEAPKLDLLNMNPELTHTSMEIDERTVTVTHR